MNLDTDLPFFVGKNKAKLWAWAKKIIVIVFFCFSRLDKKVITFVRLPI